MAKERVAGLKGGEEDGGVRLCPGVRLDVGLLGAEQLQQALDGQPLDGIDVLAAAVVPPAGVPFGVLVREHRPLRRHHRGLV